MPSFLPIDASIFAEFVDLMPPQSVQEQLHALLDVQHSDIHALAALLSQSDVQASRKAHQLKGACMIMGFTAMTNVLFQIESTAKQAQHADATALLEPLYAAVEATRVAVTAASSMNFGHSL
jgi:HPt (histidine-containing phosphotransfer) domain-containing protein